VAPGLKILLFQAADQRRRLPKKSPTLAPEPRKAIPWEMIPVNRPPAAIRQIVIHVVANLTVIPVTAILATAIRASANRAFTDGAVAAHAAIPAAVIRVRLPAIAVRPIAILVNATPVMILAGTVHGDLVAAGILPVIRAAAGDAACSNRSATIRAARDDVSQ
jgi:hypothetical protein